jgi:integrase
MSRRKLPPGAQWITLPSGQRRVELVVEAGLNPKTGKRRQARRRFKTIDDAVDAYAKIHTEAASGAFVARTSLTVDQLCRDWLDGRHGLKPKTLAGYRDVLKPVRSVYGALPVRQLTKQHLVKLVAELQQGSIPRADGTARRPWTARTVNLMLFTLGQVLDDAVKQGTMARNVAELVDRLPQTKVVMQTFTATQVTRVLTAAKTDPLEHAWHLALYGLRRGEVCGLTWDAIDFGKRTLTVKIARVSVDGADTESTPKSESGGRTLPLTDELVAVLRRAKRRQNADKKVAGRAWKDSGYLVVNAIGEPLHPETLSDKWETLLRAAKVPRIRLHDARHTCGTLLHLQGVPVAVIAAWLGHADAAFTMRTYVHSQDDALKAAALALGKRR